MSDDKPNQPQPMPTPSAIAGGTPPRFHGFDALRGGAMLLGIVLHAAITHMVEPMPGLLWPLSEQPKHLAFDAFFWWVHAWRIPLFFVMAGFFAAMLARRRGPSGFLKHRVRRVLMPVTVASFLLLPMIYCLWGWGWLIEGRVRWEEVYQFDFDSPEIEESFIGPAHLWFLYQLVTFSFFYWLVLLTGPGRSADYEPTLGPVMRWSFVSAFRPIIFALPTCALLLYDPGFYTAYHHIIPLSLEQWGYEVLQLAYHGYFFLAGIFLFRLHRDMNAIKRYAWVYLGAAQIVFVVFAMMIASQMDDTYATADEPPYRIGLAVSASLFCWLMIWGLTGLGLTVLARPSRRVRWLSDASYWVYLVHLPVVGLMMIAIRDWPIGPWSKFALVVVAASVTTLASYQYVVRYGWIGRWLNGPRSRRSAMS